ncbi:MAG: tetratricopeptide repeat protein, partial [Acidobacteriota bacterium]
MKKLELSIFFLWLLGVAFVGQAVLTAWALNARPRAMNSDRSLEKAIDLSAYLMFGGSRKPIQGQDLVGLIDEVGRIDARSVRDDRTRAWLLAQYADLLAESGSLSDAEMVSRRAVKAGEAFVESRPVALNDALLALTGFRRSLARVLFEQGRFLAAQAELEEALHVRRRAFGVGHTLTREIDVDLMKIRFALAECSEVETQLHELESALPDGSFDDFRVKRLQASCKYQQGNFKEARNLYYSILENSRHLLDEEDKLSIIENIASCMLKLEVPEHALQIDREVLE